MGELIGYALAIVILGVFFGIICYFEYRKDPDSFTRRRK